MNLRISTLILPLIITLGFAQTQKLKKWLPFLKSEGVNSAAINNDTLYICTDGEGLIQVDLPSKTISSFQIERIGPNPRMIKFDRNGSKYVLCTDSLIIKYDKKSHSKIIIPKNTKAPKNEYEPDQITSMVVTPEIISITKKSCVQLFTKGIWKTYSSADDFSMENFLTFIDTTGNLWVYNTNNNVNTSKEPYFASLVNNKWNRYTKANIIGRICGITETNQISAFTSTLSRYNFNDTGFVRDYEYKEIFPVKESSLELIGTDNAGGSIYLLHSFKTNEYFISRLTSNATREIYPIDFSKFGLTDLYNNKILDVITDKNGNPWIILKSMVLGYSDNSWNQFPISVNPFKNKMISSITVDDSGAVWVADNGISVFNNGVWKTYTEADSIAGPVDRISGLFNFNGAMYTSTLEGSISRYKNGSWKDLSYLPGKGDEDEIQHISFHPDRDGRLFLSQKTSGTDFIMSYQVTDSSVDIITLYSNLPQCNGPISIMDYAIADSNQLYIATSCGLYKGKDSTWTITKVGNDSFQFPTEVFYESGKLYTEMDYSLYKYTSGKWQRCAPSIKDMRTLSIIHDKNGILYAGTMSNGLIKINAQNKVIPFDSQKPSMVSGSSVTSLAFDRDGNLWIGTGSGLCIYNESGIKGKIASAASSANTFKPIKSYVQQRM